MSQGYWIQDGNRKFNLALVQHMELGKDGDKTGVWLHFDRQQFGRVFLPDPAGAWAWQMTKADAPRAGTQPEAPGRKD